MKKLIMIVALMTAMVSTSWAAGSVAQSLEKVRNSQVAILTFEWTGDASDGTVPDTDTSAAITTAIQGYGIFEVRTTPGSTAPTPDYDVTIEDENGLDLMGGALADRSETASEAAFPQIAANDKGMRVVDGALTLTISNTIVHSATGTIKIYMAR